MKIEVFADADSVAREAAAIIAAEARASVAARGRFIVALTGGHTPCSGMHVAQVDECVAPAGDPDRNLTHLRESLLDHVRCVLSKVYAIPVESLDLEAAAKLYAITLAEIAGLPPVFDLIPPGTRARGGRCLLGAWRSGPPRYRHRRCSHRNLTREAVG
jgi:6-phosphogluconolactonase